MRSYTHLSEDERDQIGFCGPRGGRWGPLPGRSVGRKPPSPGSCTGTHSLWAGTRRFTPPEPINCAGGKNVAIMRPAQDHARYDDLVLRRL